MDVKMVAQNTECNEDAVVDLFAEAGYHLVLRERYQDGKRKGRVQQSRWSNAEPGREWLEGNIICNFDDGTVEVQVHGDHLPDGGTVLFEAKTVLAVAAALRELGVQI